MYVDSGGHVATGAGHRLPNAAAAAALPWRHRGTGRAATRPDIDDAFHRVRVQGSGRTALAYRVASDLVLPAGVAGDLVIARLDEELLPGLRAAFRSYDRYPAPARRALVEMAFDLGVARLRKFRNLIAACERGDFATAAEHCHRPGRREARNAATRALFCDAANDPRRRLENERGCG
jgi:hypothetical protein